MTPLRVLRRLVLPSAAALLIVLASCFSPSSTPGPAAPGTVVAQLHDDLGHLDEAEVTIATANGEVVVAALVAEEPEDRRRGLMHVPEVPDGVGMLFVFPEERSGGFWMKDTLVPLDIAFVDAAGGVVAILTMEPCAADPCPEYDPEVAYLVALEVRGGWLAEVGVEVGDTLSWERSAVGGALSWERSAVGGALSWVRAGAGDA